MRSKALIPTPSAIQEDGRFARALAYLDGFVDLERGGFALAPMGLDRIRALLDALGNPQRQYPSVLIAGTKGKGSTAAMVERALRAGGARTGLYTQPHLHTIRERVRVGGELISEDAFGLRMDVVRAVVEGLDGSNSGVTAYEVMTALALHHFAESHVDVAVLEVGLGGRLDATNAVDASVSAVTSISLDHTQVLGDTVEAIASEKADIIKSGRPCVSAPQPPSAMAVIREVARSRGARLLVAGENGVRWAAPPSQWDLLTRHGRLPSLKPALKGTFQRTNITVAATILDALEVAGAASIDLDALRAGIEEVVWPGRFELVASDPTTIVDGAHNVESAYKLRESLDEEFSSPEVILVLGIADDKDVTGIVHSLRPARLLVATRAHHPRAADPARIAAEARAEGMTTIVEPDVRRALNLGRERAGASDVVVATGSLYVVAEAREALGLAQPSEEAVFRPWAGSGASPGSGVGSSR
jgi:dihydrofolate synthase/folylpolyglutamate synthase